MNVDISAKMLILRKRVTMNLSLSDQKKVSRVLFGKRIVTLDIASLVAGTKYRGQFDFK